MSSSAIYPYPEHWELTTLGQLCTDSGGGVQTGPFGSQLHAADYVDVGIPSIMPKNISIEGVSTEDIARITKEDAQRLSKYLVKEGDIVYSRRGDVEKSSLITEKENGWLCGTGCLKVSFGKNSSVPSGYIHAYLSHPAIREWISRHAVGATMPNLNTSILSAVPVLVPPKDEIDIILSVWKNTTDKIILNRQTNQTLENMAQAIFKSWFVDFEPTRAKIAAKEEWAKKSMTSKAGGNDNNIKESQAEATFVERAAMAAISGRAIDSTNYIVTGALAGLDQLNTEQIQQLKTTAGLFPDTLVDSELGEIPEGWEDRNLGDFVSLQGGLSYKSSFMGSGNPMVTMGCIDPEKRFKSDKLKYYFGEFKVQHRLKPGDLVISTRDVTQARVTLGAPALIPKYLGDEIILATNMYKLVSKGLCLPNEYLFEILRTARYREQIIASAKGTTVLMLTKDALLKYKFAYPSRNLIKYASKLFEDIYVKIEQSNEECENLSKLRDGLLPRLLSGELSIDNVV
jgi:type I restriction enzyme S subunit